MSHRKSGAATERVKSRRERKRRGWVNEWGTRDGEGVLGGGEGGERKCEWYILAGYS